LPIKEAFNTHVKGAKKKKERRNIKNKRKKNKRKKEKNDSREKEREQERERQQRVTKPERKDKWRKEERFLKVHHSPCKRLKSYKELS